MPADFDKCVSDGGKVVTKELKGNKYIHICYDKKGNSHSGEVKEKKKSKSVLDRAEKVKKELKDLLK